MQEFSLEELEQLPYTQSLVAIQRALRAAGIEHDPGPDSLDIGIEDLEELFENEAFMTECVSQFEAFVIQNAQESLEAKGLIRRTGVLENGEIAYELAIEEDV